MIYEKSIFIPAGAPEDMPIVTTFNIRENAISQLEIMMDTVATNGLVAVKINVGRPGFKVWNFPIEQGDWIRKALNAVFNPPIPLREVNLPCTITAAAPSTTFNHTVMVTIHTTTLPS